MGHHDESLLDKVKNALGMGDDDSHDADHHVVGARDTETDADRADGWAGVPDALHDDPVTGGAAPDDAAPAHYEGGATMSDLGGTDLDADRNPDLTREDAAATEFGGAYGTDETPMPTSEAADRGVASDDPDLVERRSPEV